MSLTLTFASPHRGYPYVVEASMQGAVAEPKYLHMKYEEAPRGTSEASTAGLPNTDPQAARPPALRQPGVASSLPPWCPDRASTRTPRISRFPVRCRHRLLSPPCLMRQRGEKHDRVSHNRSARLSNTAASSPPASSTGTVCYRNFCDLCIGSTYGVPKSLCRMM